ncbi:DUF4396 domain-containing protein [Nocardioides sp. SYSU D00038]|uniref:DUF4396 domain-containing protein n=1 Tax=Nocardioides sp. SYSU D00038 TaxID=2812554 RepID=UPI001F07220B|nr:DUF4396 domain-containing protein [Nocardioides sp. SYSU D00038]
MTAHQHTHDHQVPHDAHGSHDGLTAMAVSATLHCLTGCAIGEVLGMLIGTAAGLATGWTIALSVSLAFLLGYALSTLPLLRAGLAVPTALGVVLAADTLSILTMEVVDNAVMALVPGAMDAGLVNPTFWWAMALALAVAFVAAVPVNRLLLQRGRGHALTHAHPGTAAPEGWRRRVPDLSTPALVAAVAAFLLGGLVVSAAAEDDAAAGGHAAAVTNR